MSKDSEGNIPRGLLTRKGAPAGIAGPSRLPTMRNPRDLTLGGSSKKTFVPNIPVRRNKEETKPAEDVKESKAENFERKGKKEGGKERSKGRFQDNIIQTHSIFEEGPAAASLSKSRTSNVSSYYSNNGKDETAGTSRLAIKQEKMEISDIDIALRDDFIDYKNDTSDDCFEPISLPLPSSVGQSKSAPAKPIVQVKTEDLNGEKMDIDASANSNAAVAVDFSTPKDLFLKSDDCDSDKQFLLFQLPDVLPLIPPEKDRRRPEKDSKSDNSSGENKTASESSKSTNNYNLSEFPSGPIGKLRVHKSGRVTLVLGGLCLEVSQGTPVGYLQELTSVHLNETNGGDMCVLGHVTEKLICSPMFESLLEDR